MVTLFDSVLAGVETVAVIVGQAVPKVLQLATAVTMPLEVTVAIAVLELLQLTNEEISALPLMTFTGTVAVNCVLEFKLS